MERARKAKVKNKGDLCNIDTDNSKQNNVSMTGGPTMPCDAGSEESGPHVLGRGVVVGSEGDMSVVDPHGDVTNVNKGKSFKNGSS